MTDGEYVGAGGESAGEAVGPDGQVAIRAATGAALAAGGGVNEAFFDLFIG